MFSGWLAVRSSMRAQSLPTLSTPFLVSVLILAILLGFSGLAQSAEVTLEWDPVTDPRVAMYEVHWGISSGQYEGSVTSETNTAEIAGLQEGETYFFVAKACTEDRATCSSPSEEVSTTLPFAKPRAGFTVDSSSGVAPYAVVFTDTSSGEIDFREWDFGDGTTSTAPAPTHIYALPGFYTVSLTVSGPGGSATAVMTDAVSVTSAPPGADEDSIICSPFSEGVSGPVPFAQHQPGHAAIIEVGEIALDHGWTRVDFEHSFFEPIVIVKSMSGNDDDPAVVRLDDLDTDGFWVRVQEWDYLDGGHDEEIVSYMVIERGRHQLPDGAWIEAGRVVIDSDPAFVTTAFEVPFASKPVVLATVTTNNEADAVTTRMRNIDEYGFDLGLQEQEANPREHAPETIAYVAWEPSSGEIEGMHYTVGHTADKVRHRPYTIAYSTIFNLPPVFLADMQTTDGPDTSNLRWRDNNTTSVDIWVHEEQSRDSETSHTTEIVGYIAFGSANALVIEAGEIDVDDQWEHVDLGQSFSDPIVIAKSLSAYDDDPAVIRVDAVDGDGFWIRLQRWDYQQGIHAPETVSYVVVERGRHQLPSGAWIEANRIETQATNAFVDTAFQSPFATTPVVLTTVTTDNEEDAITTRVRNIDKNGFQVGLREQEANPQAHAFETITYLAWEPSVTEIDGLRFEIGRTNDVVKSSPHTLVYSIVTGSAPLFIADMQTTDGGDTANLRWDNKGTASVDVWVDEEQSKDSEIAHTTEVVGYLIIDDILSAESD